VSEATPIEPATAAVRVEPSDLAAENALLRALLIDLMAAATPFANYGAWLAGRAEQDRLDSIAGRPINPVRKGPTIAPSEFRTVARAVARVLREAPKT